MRGPFFSPDGRWVGFWATGQLKKVPLAGGALVTLCDLVIPPHGASWEDNGKILFGARGGIWQVSDAGGQPERLIELDESLWTDASDASGRRGFCLWETHCRNGQSVSPSRPLLLRRNGRARGERIRREVPANGPSALCVGEHAHGSPVRPPSSNTSGRAAPHRRGCLRRRSWQLFRELFRPLGSTRSPVPELLSISPRGSSLFIGPPSSPSAPRAPRCRRESHAGSPTSGYRPTANVSPSTCATTTTSGSTTSVEER